jgi:hypothetical protein
VANSIRMSASHGLRRYPSPHLALLLAAEPADDEEVLRIAWLKEKLGR